jgi:Cys-tRNA(Pro) deacylase
MAARDTPATRVATAAGIPFSVHEYAHDERAASYGLEAVEKLGVDAARVFKTLVADVDGTLTVCVVPVERRLDLGALGKRARMADERAAERATGTSSAGSARSDSGVGSRPSWTRALPGTRARPPTRPRCGWSRRPRPRRRG